MENMKITLTSKQYEGLTSLEQGQTLELTYHGIDCWIEKAGEDDCFNIEYKGNKYLLNFFCPTKVKMSVKEEPKQEESKKQTTFVGAEFEPNKMHVYDVKTKGKHPVHLIEGGSYITEDERGFEPSGDMGWFWLNEREYQYYKSKEHTITISE